MKLYNYTIYEIGLPSIMLMCSSAFSLCRLMEKCNLGYRMELLVVITPVCSETQGVSSAEADIQEKNMSVSIRYCEPFLFFNY